jgi:hypothetical protein
MDEYPLRPPKADRYSVVAWLVILPLVFAGITGYYFFGGTDPSVKERAHALAKVQVGHEVEQVVGKVVTANFNYVPSVHRREVIDCDSKRVVRSGVSEGYYVFVVVSQRASGKVTLHFSYDIARDDFEITRIDAPDFSASDGK